MTKGSKWFGILHKDKMRMKTFLRNQFYKIHGGKVVMSIELRKWNKIHE